MDSKARKDSTVLVFTKAACISFTVVLDGLKIISLIIDIAEMRYQEYHSTPCSLFAGVSKTEIAV